MGKSRETGEWYYTDDGGNTWVRGTPPGYRRTPTINEPGTQTPPQQPYTPPPPPGQSPGYEIRPPGASVPGYLLPASIVATLLCCLPTGIAAIVYSAQAGSKSQAGDTAGATQSVRNANIWLVLSLVGGIFWWGYWIGQLANV